MKSFFLIALIILSFSENYSQTEIAQFRGTERNGLFPGKNLLTRWPEGGPELLWKFDDLGNGYSSPIVTSDRVFEIGTIDNISYVFSFDHNGKLLWRKPLGKEYAGEWAGIYSTPVICNNLGYVVNGLGVLYCFSTENGSIIWSRNILNDYMGQKASSGFLDNLLVDGEKLYCTPGGKGMNMVALDRKNGDLIWASGGDTIVNAYCTPILVENNGKKYCIYQTSKLINALDAGNGKLAWSYKKRGSSPPNTPVYQNGYLFVPDYNSGSIKLRISSDWKEVTEVWRTTGLQTNIGDAVVLGGRVFGKGKKDKFYCVDWNTGKELYTEPDKNMVTTVITADNLLYCYHYDGTFQLIKPLNDKFEKVGSFQVKGGSENHCSHPVINDGKLYIRHDNSLFVYNIANGHHN
jgi:outer membrane protein assembly factor BamB